VAFEQNADHSEMGQPESEAFHVKSTQKNIKINLKHILIKSDKIQPFIKVSYYANVRPVFYGLLMLEFPKKCHFTVRLDV
jgi:hypothetical protein